MPDNNDVPTKRDNLAFIVGGLFILGLIFATYAYFNRSPAVEETPTTDVSDENTLEKLKEMISSSTEREEEEERVDNAEAFEQEAESTQTITWRATDYKSGDIKKGSYTVKTGDTLWEIAEAVYGNGAEWTTILQTNASSIGFLPNGEQALIIPGQVLSLP